MVRNNTSYILMKQVNGRKVMIYESLEDTAYLFVGRKIVGKAMVGSTVNPLDRGGTQYREMYYSSDVNERNANGRTKTGLYGVFIPAYDALEGFLTSTACLLLKTQRNLS